MSMKARVLRAPLAVTSEGDVLLNVVELDVAADVASVVRALAGVDGYVFVGVMLRRDEARGVLRDVAMLLPNVTGPVGSRRRRRR
jgi:hypothetical protein